MTQYDNIAEQYDQSAEVRDDREQVLVPSAKHYLGDLHGQRVLDLACGSGYFTRLIKSWGAKQVLGIDISPEMIELAQKRERETPQSIEYLVADVSKVDRLGEFDIVFAGFLLHYSSSIDELRSMCNGVANNLRSGGELVCFNENPFFPVHSGIKYGVAVKAFGDIGDGTKIERTHYTGDKKDFSFEHYHYEPATYETALKSAGFTNIEWKNFVCAENAQERTLAYWQEYPSGFSITVLLCSKG
jgi:toxoflavin synthase